jgi:hypothetical protein
LLILPTTARRIMVTVCPADPKNINLRRPTLSIKNIATNAQGSTPWHYTQL